MASGSRAELPLDHRKALFASLVRLQDEGEGVTRSRRLVAREFGVEVDDVLAVEREGMDGGWPPL